MLLQLHMKNLLKVLEKMVTQELTAKAMDDVSRQAFEEEKRRIASQKKAAQATSTNKLSTNRQFVSTDRQSVSTDRPFVSTDRSNTPYVSTDSTPTGANAGESSFVYLGGKIPIDASTLPNADLPIDPNMPDLEDASDTLPNDGIFNGAYDDDEDVGAVADFNNMDNTIAVSPIPTLRIHKDHPKGQILGDPTSAVQTRRKIQKASSAQQALTISHALQDESWVKAMQEELLQFKLQKVWVLVGLPSGKKDKDLLIYQMDVTSAFLMALLKRGVCSSTLQLFFDPAHPNKVYKVIKALYGLHQAPRAWYKTLSSFLMENGFRRVKQQPDGIFISQEKYVADILKKFDFLSIRTATTPIESNKSLVKDEDGVDVDVHVYRSMIGSLMYLTASRPNIMFVVCACARFQVTLKALHLNAVKRIFRYLKHQPKLGLWYPRDSPFELEPFSDSDYGGASLDRKSTTGGCQFLGRRLISWQCKKQTIVENSTTEAEYVAAANCCGQVLWIHNQMMDYGFNFMNTKIHIDNESTTSVIKNPVAHSKTKHIEIRFHFIRDCYEKRLIKVIKIHTDSNVADLLTKGFDVTRFNFLVVSIRLYLGSRESLERDMDGTAEFLLSNLFDFWLTKVSTDRQGEGTADQNEGKSATQTAPTTTSTPTPTIFGDDETIAQVLITMSQNKQKEKEKGVEIRNVEDTERPRPTSTRFVLTLKPLPKIDLKDKGKKMIDELKLKRSLKCLLRMKRWPERFKKNRKLKRKRKDKILAEELQKEEREKFTIEQRAKFLHDTIAAQRKFLAQQRSKAIRNKPPIRNQLRNQMMTYLKHVGGKKHSDLKTKTFEEIQVLYERLKRQDQNFVAIGSAEDERQIKELNKDPKKKRVIKETPRKEDTTKVSAEQEVTEQGTKKRKSGHVKMIARKRPRPQPDDDSDDEHRKCLRIVTFDSTIDSEIMETKSFIARLHKVSSPDGNYLVVYRVNGHFRAFNYLIEVLHIFDRHDLFHLYDLVMKQYSEITPEDIELILWGDLKIMMESSTEENDQGDF
ncbi:putative ribonuclease H-like domain-containing protein [Tanacetum coccineum]